MLIFDDETSIDRNSDEMVDDVGLARWMVPDQSGTIHNKVGTQK